MRIRMNIGKGNRGKVKMSKSNVLELARKLVAAIEKEDQKNKVMLKDIPVGGKFNTGIGRFIVLEQKEDCTAVITEDLYRDTHHM